MQHFVKLSADEVRNLISYQLICETRYGSRWDTGKRRREWVSMFSESERKSSTAIFKKAHEWTLTRGVPDEVLMSTKTLKLWVKIGCFCACL